jgi:lipopolysaccharide/colanic/teichoic acid biosynthesis glycosyltransferase
MLASGRTPPRAQLVVKRVGDLVLAAIALAVLSPLLLAVSVAIKLDSPGPVFFTQTRRGRGFKPFTVVKFRSLEHRAPDPNPRYEMLAGDPRITRVGALLRSSSIDELPQLFNVLAGSMSVVGPRPLVEWESQLALSRFGERFAAKPWITGLSQVTVRNAVDFDARCEKDVEYVRRWSLVLDLRILLDTPAALLRSEAVYPRQ